MLQEQPKFMQIFIEGDKELTLQVCETHRF